MHCPPCCRGPSPGKKHSPQDDNASQEGYSNSEPALTLQSLRHDLGPLPPDAKYQTPRTLRRLPGHFRRGECPLPRRFQSLAGEILAWPCRGELCGRHLTRTIHIHPHYNFDLACDRPSRARRDLRENLPHDLPRRRRFSWLGRRCRLRCRRCGHRGSRCGRRRRACRRCPRRRVRRGCRPWWPPVSTGE